MESVNELCTIGPVTFHEAIDRHDIEQERLGLRYLCGCLTGSDILLRVKDKATGGYGDIGSTLLGRNIQIVIESDGLLGNITLI